MKTLSEVAKRLREDATDADCQCRPCGLIREAADLIETQERHPNTQSAMLREARTLLGDWLDYTRRVL